MMKFAKLDLVHGSVQKLHTYFVFCLSLSSATIIQTTDSVFDKENLFFFFLHESGSWKACYEGAGVCVEGSILMSRERVMV